MRVFLSILLITVTSLHAWSQAEVDSSRIIKVLSFNILHGATTQGNFDLDAIARVIINADPDLVALQEVDFKTNRAHGYDLATELGWRARMVPLFGKAMPYDGGEYGEALLSKFTFLTSRAVSLPYSPGNEPRTALEIVTIIPSGDTIAFIGTHLDHLKDDTDRVQQAKALNEVFIKNTYPTLLVGDLNDTPGSNVMNILEQYWSSSYTKEDPAPTFPSNNPIKKIDYVLFSPADKWQVLTTEVLQDSIASDHCGYLVTLKLLEQ